MEVEYKPSAKLQILAILKRNLIIKRRAKQATIQEVLVPVLFLGVLLSIPNNIAYYDSVVNQPTFQFPTQPIPFSAESQILFFTPQSALVNNLIGFIQSSLPNVTVIGVNSTADIQEQYKLSRNPDNSIPFWAGVSFDNVQANDTNFPNDIKYTIFMDANNIPSINQKYSNLQECRKDRSGKQSGCTAFLYFSSGFAALQRSIDSSILQIKNASDTDTLFTQLAPKDVYVFTQTVATYLYPIYLILCFTPFIQSLIVRLVTEKEKKLRQGMEIMGLSDTSYYVSWFLTYGITVFVFSILFTALGSIQYLWVHSNKIIIFLLLFLFGISLVGIGFIATVFFTSARAAGGVTSVIMLILSVVNIGIQTSNSSPLRWALSIFSPLAYTLAISEIIQQEGFQTGVQWSTINGNPLFSVQDALIMLVVDTFVYIILGWYLGKVVPTGDSVARPWWFPLEFVLGKKEYHIPEEFQQLTNDSYEQAEHVGETVTMELRGLSREFSSHKAVDNLNLRVYEGEIFALLGHNGAGKTTTISMLTGLVQPSAGTALVYGHDIRTDMPAIRNIIGLCPQHDLLFDELTVNEHLSFYGQLRGLSGESLIKESHRLVTAVQLQDKVDSRSDQLSGGMKRKLSLAISLISNPKVLFLDEPTSGMDPYSRRAIWELLNQSKRGRTIILTTHYMDEADYLADRVAIMSKGKLQCMGSTLFLKNRFGVNYYLNIEKTKETDLEALEGVVTSIIPMAREVSVYEEEVVFALPLANVERFSSLFAELESKSKDLGIHSFGVTLTSLEEVFLKLAAEEEKHDHEAQININSQTESKEAKEIEFLQEPTIMRQVQALSLTKYKQFFRNANTVFCSLVMPIILLLIGCILSYTNKPSHNELSSLVLGPSIYGENSLPVLNSTGFQLPYTSANFQFTWINAEMEQYLYDHSPNLGGITFNTFNVSGNTYSETITFNDTQVHSLPLLINLYDNLKLQQHGNMSVETSITPLGGQLSFDSNQFASTFLIGFSILFTPVGFITALVKDNSTGYKRQLVVMGLKNAAYWFSCFLTDMSMYLTLSISAFIFTWAFSIGYSGAAFLAFVVLILECQISLTLFCYLWSFIFKNPETVIRVTSLIIQLIALVPAIVVMILSNISESTRETSYYLHYIFCAIDPPYTLIGSLNFLTLVPLLRAFNSQPAPTVGDYFQEKTIYVPMITCLLHIIIFSCVIYYVDFVRFFRQSKESSQVENDDQLMDHDVVAERKLVDELVRKDKEPTDALILDHLKKVYTTSTGFLWHKKTKKQIAVQDICLRVKKGECFGLLGPNGAGKTTILSIITGDIKPTQGTAYVNGKDINKELAAVYQLTGYCPQIDPFPVDLTGRELLELFAIIKGYNREAAKYLATSQCRDMGITEHIDKRTKGYSGGTKRKLSVALALVASPKVVYLDEPSSGIDPASRHFLWDVIKANMGNRTTILTSHSMEEVQALCTRLAIMINGQFQCLGSPQHLKDRFGSGYNLEIKSSEDMVEIMKDNLPEAELEEQVNGHYKFVIDKKHHPVSHIFETIVKLTRKHSIHEYAVSQSTLEQIFIKFAKHQVEIQ